MATKSFGKRGLSTAGVSRYVPEATPVHACDGQSDEIDDGTLFLASMPIATVGLIVTLLFIFGLEQRFAFEHTTKGSPSVLSLTAFGAASYDLVVGAGQAWRLALAPLLHASFSHFLGNSIALFFIGMRLEPLVGRSWLTAIFVLSALGGVAGSLVGNPHAVVTVGASGAITGLLGALFAVSFHPNAARHDQKAMRLTAVRFGVPALGPLVWGASGNTDYHAHFGGAVTGVAVALALCAVWSEHRFRPNFKGLALAIVAAALVTSAAGTAFAVRGFATYASKASAFMPVGERSKLSRLNDGDSAALLQRYPTDPSAHVSRAIYLMLANKNFAAEMELRSALSLVGTDARRRAAILPILAQVVALEGRREEAKGLVHELCGGPNRVSLKKAKLCD